MPKNAVSRSDSKQRRYRRLQAAQVMLGDSFEVLATSEGLPDLLGEADTSADALFEDEDIVQGMSGNNLSEVSSHLFKPRWKRLLRAASRLLSEKLEKGDDTLELLEEKRLREAFTATDAIGGGSAEDVFKLFERSLEILALSDKDTGFVLLSVYQSLLAPDLPISAVTWRPVLLTAIFVAIDKVVEDEAQRTHAKRRMELDAAHWWTTSRMHTCCEIFASRELYRTLDTSRSALARLYFDLRDRGLQLSPDNSSNASAINLQSNASHTSHTSHGAARAGRFNPASQGLSEFSSSLLQISETQSFSGSHDYEPRSEATDGQERRRIVMSL
mmetsp:Transcript_25119/g.83790  ORF Transcript_25119/g.83790 Transcript_25119/m.83790 type:complete len:330 (+) Transcript_25119:66-1055(+)